MEQVASGLLGIGRCRDGDLATRIVGHGRAGEPIQERDGSLLNAHIHRGVSKGTSIGSGGGRTGTLIGGISQASVEAMGIGRGDGRDGERAAVRQSDRRRVAAGILPDSSPVLGVGGAATTNIRLDNISGDRGAKDTPVA